MISVYLFVGLCILATYKVISGFVTVPTHRDPTVSTALGGDGAAVTMARYPHSVTLSWYWGKSNSARHFFCNDVLPCQVVAHVSLAIRSVVLLVHPGNQLPHGLVEGQYRQNSSLTKGLWETESSTKSFIIAQCLNSTLCIQETLSNWPPRQIDLSLTSITLFGSQMITHARKPF